MEKSRNRENWIEYKNVYKIVKSAVSRAEHNKYDKLYERLETQEGEKNIYGLMWKKAI